MPKYLLKLYISGKNQRTEQSLSKLRSVLDELPVKYELNVCDVIENPQAAEDDKILATPTLMLISPPPAKRIIGDLAEAEKIIVYLGIPFKRRRQRGKLE